MPTFAELYCARRHLAPHWFRLNVFWRTLPWYVVPFAPLLLLSNHFEADMFLIDACGRATRLEQIYEEIRDHPLHPRNRGWLRRFAKLRVSRGLLCRLAKDCLTAARPALVDDRAGRLSRTGGEPG